MAYVFIGHYFRVLRHVKKYSPVHTQNFEEFGDPCL